MSDTRPFCIRSRFTSYSRTGLQFEPFNSAELQVCAPRFLALHQSITVTAWPLRVTPGFHRVIQVVFKKTGLTPMGAAGWDLDIPSAE